MATTTTTTLSAGLAYGLSVIPVVLIASSAIFINHAMRYETVLHRCQIQIGMWLALTLASSVGWSVNDEASDQQQIRILCFLWAHLAIFFNLSAIVTEALQDSVGLGLSRKQEAFRNFLQVLPISCWWPMSLVAIAGFIGQKTTTTTTIGFLSFDNLWKFSLGVFLGRTLVLGFFRAVAARHRRISANLQGTTLPTTTVSDSMLTGGIIARICVMVPTSNYYKPNSQLDSTLYLDERQWYNWSKLQTTQWFVQQLKGDNDENNKILSILCKHCITGDILDFLDASQLVALQIPFGPACKLSDAIAGLVERFPKPRIINGVRQRSRWGNSVPTEARPSRDYLDNYDDEYNNNNTSSEEELLRNNNPPMEQQQQQQQQQVNGVGRQEPPPQMPQPAYPNESGGGMTEEQHEKLNQVMKDRFGLELPKLRATDFLAVQKGLNAQNNGHGAVPSEGIPPSHPFAASVDPSMTNNYSNGNTTVPIAQELQNGSPSSARMASPSTLSADIPEDIFKGMPPELQEIAKRRPDLVQKIWKQKQQVLKANSKPRTLPALPEISGDEEEFDSDNEDETTSLIQSDSIHPGRYKSVDKSRLPSIV